jgi:hypothetical protein
MNNPLQPNDEQDDDFLSGMFCGVILSMVALIVGILIYLFSVT